MNPASLIAAIFRFDPEAMLADPVQLGAFLELAEMITELEPRVHEAAITFAMQGKEIPGWSLVRREGSRFVESTHVHELLLQCPAQRLPGLLEAVSKAIGSVSEARWKSLCEIVGKDGEGAVSQAGAKTFLRRRSLEGNQQITNQERS